MKDDKRIEEGQPLSAGIIFSCKDTGQITGL